MRSAAFGRTWKGPMLPSRTRERLKKGTDEHPEQGSDYTWILLSASSLQSPCRCEPTKGGLNNQMQVFSCQGRTCQIQQLLPGKHRCVRDGLAVLRAEQILTTFASGCWLLWSPHFICDTLGCFVSVRSEPTVVLL